MTLSARLQVIRNGFTSVFWIANALELFERLAFYGAKAVLAFFLAKRVGLEEEAGTLTGWFSTLIYALPVVAGVFVDKYGFKKTLAACFAIFAVGYLAIGLAGMEWGAQLTQAIGVRNYVIIVLVLTAIGGSLIKPCIVGTVAKTSKADSKALGFSIYYTIVNIGGSIGPIVALWIRNDWGIEYVLVMSSITSALLFIGTLLFYKEPDAEGEVGSKKTFGQVFSDMALVFTNFKFISFLIIFSGLWLMFWQIFYLLPFYATDVLKFENFEILETVDAWGIIVLTMPMAALVKEWKPIRAMILGLALASVSWFIIGAFGTVTAVVIGVFIYALGEATQAPRFYEYVASLAPKDQVGTFMGFAFLPVAVGSLTAGYVSDWLRLNFLTTNPHAMWFYVGGIGVATTIAIIIYNIIVSSSKTEPGRE